MAWINPPTRSTGVLITSSIWNQDIVANTIALKEPPTDTYEINEVADYSIVNTSAFTDIDATDLSLSITTTGGDVLLIVTINALGATAGDRIFFDITEDGTRLGGDDGIWATSAATGTVAPGQDCSFSYLRVSPTAAAHTYKLQWKTDGASTWTLYAGAGTANGDTHGQFVAREV